MFINYRGTNVHALPYITYRAVKLRNKKTGKTRIDQRVDNKQTPQEVHWLRPGWNEFPSHIWKQNENAPSIRAMLKKGLIVLMADKVVKKVKNKATGKAKTVEMILGQDDSEMTLKFFEESRAIEIVKDTLNRDILQRWLDEESRHKVKRALTKQIEPLLNNTKDEDDED